MDKKTMERVINNMAEKIEKLEKINLLNAERNIVNMKHFKTFDKRCNDLFKMFEFAEDKIKVLENKSKDERIKRLDLSDRLGDLRLKDKARIEVLEENEALNLNRIESLEDNIDDLEAKNYILKSDLDKLINGDETITLGEFSKFKNWEEFNEAMREGHETIKRVKARNGENNE